MKIIRLIGDTLLAVILCAVLVALVLLVYGRAMAGPWQNVAAGQALPDGQLVWVDEHPLYVRTWGPEDGQPVVLVSGLEVGASAMWAELAPSLGRAGHRVIAIDLPTLGYSSRDVTQDLTARGEANTLAMALNQLGAQGAHVVAQGWGSAIALQLALDQPQFVRSLVLVGPQMTTGIDRYELFVAELPLAQDAVTWLVRGGGPVWRVLLRRQVAVSSDAFQTYVKAAQQSSQIEGTVAALAGFYNLDPASDQLVAIGAVQAPCLVVRGEQDRLVTATQADDLAFELGAKRRAVAEAGHLVALDQPQALQKELLAFWLP